MCSAHKEYHKSRSDKYCFGIFRKQTAIDFFAQVTYNIKHNGASAEESGKK